MTFWQFKRKFEEEVKPYRYLYEHDEKSHFYYFTIYKTSLKTIFISIHEKTIKDDILAKNRIKSIKELYNKKPS